MRAVPRPSKEGYRAEVEKFRTAVAEWFDQREAAARKDGNKKLVDQIKAERAAFAMNGEVPPKAPPALKRIPKAARAKLEAAFETAVKEYTKARKDDQAAAVEKELSEFKKGSVSPEAEPPVGDRRLWVQPKGYFLKGAGKDWFEKWDDGRKTPNLFYETQRTSEFVELRNAHVPVTFRLYVDRAVVRDDKQGGDFKPAYRGRWHTPPE